MQKFIKRDVDNRLESSEPSEVVDRTTEQDHMVNEGYKTHFKSSSYQSILEKAWRKQARSVAIPTNLITVFQLTMYGKKGRGFLPTSIAFHLWPQSFIAVPVI